MKRAAAWLMYRLCRAVAVPGPWSWSWVDGRYPKTPAGAVRYFREQVAPAEVFWYERQAGARAAADLEPYVGLARARRELNEACARWAADRTR